MAQLTLNAKFSNIMKMTSFFVNYEKKSNLFEKLKNKVFVEATMKKENMIKMIQENIFKMQTSSTMH